jgi:Lon protease-like protein
VLFPGLLLPLNVFEPRYRQLVQDLEVLPEADRAFGVIGIRQGREVGTDGTQDLYTIGCLAQVKRIEPQDDGRYHLVTAGSRRFRLREVIREETPYLRAEVEWLPEGDPEPALALREPLTAAFHAYLSALGAARQVELELPDPPADPLVLGYLVAATMLADLTVKQELLEAADGAARMQAELRLLRRETALLAKLPATPATELTRMPSSPN